MYCLQPRYCSGTASVRLISFIAACVERVSWVSASEPKSWLTHYLYVSHTLYLETLVLFVALNMVRTLGEKTRFCISLLQRSLVQVWSKRSRLVADDGIT